MTKCSTRSRKYLQVFKKIFCPRIKFLSILLKKIQAKITACIIVRDLAPTDVAKEFATSLAPIPIDAINENNPPV